MSEQDEQRPLTRRERRMRDLGETGAMDLSEIVGDGDAPTSAVPAAAPAPESPIEISPFHEDGTPRSRREMRQLRDEALAAQGRAAADSAEVAVTEPEGAGAAAGENLPGPDTTVSEPLDASGPETAADGTETPAPAPAQDEPDFDTLMSPPTEPFTVEELREAEAMDEKDSADPAPPESQATEVSATEVSATEVSAPDESAPEESASEESAPGPASASDEFGEPAASEAPAKPKRRFPWQRSKQSGEAGEADGAETGEVAGGRAEASSEPETEPAREAEPVIEPEPIVADETAVDVDSAAETAPEAEPEPVIEAELVEAEPAPPVEAETTVLEAAQPEVPSEAPEDLPVAPPETVALPTQAADDEPSSSVAQEGAELKPATTDGPREQGGANPQHRESYSFPDIAPPEEWRSVFDDPSGRQFPNTGETPQSGDFDDLISRAVAQEGSTGSTGTSALILPTMPEDTGGLTGPLGATGDLYVTGSLKLPRSLGETGGHSALHDSIEMHPITGDQMPQRDEGNEGPAPVSARHAVSARVDSGIPVVAKPTREKSKLPLVLSLTGGGLLVVVVGLGAWGASNGFFG
ncbi:hypothetical protein [Leucobacter sp. NPDC077196]|uniref:hypothetical protein n=1 Tax=Leucobacter sp. NPDC077196 TaxID=3154959 RepID=UPI0034134C19